jgi:hypothetical protein
MTAFRILSASESIWVPHLKRAATNMANHTVAECPAVLDATARFLLRHHPADYSQATTVCFGYLTLAAQLLPKRPSFRFVGLDRVHDALKFRLLGGTLWTALKYVSPPHEDCMHRVGYSRHKDRHARIIGRMHPLASKCVTKLLELPNGCNALHIDIAHGTGSQIFIQVWGPS